MKKLLLSALLFAGATFATSAQSNEVVVFEEDFEWIAPWLNPAVVDNVGENDHETSTPRYESITNGDVYLRNALWDKGYWFYGIKKDGTNETALGAQSVYAAANYLKFGKTSVQAYMRFSGCEEIPADATAYIEFDWCPQRQGTGVFDPIRLEVYIGAATKVLETKDHNFENGHKLEWIHEKAEFKGVTINTDTQFHIRPVEEYWGVAGAHRYYLDNIKISYKKNGTSGIDDITVNEENAPVEYYNLQGVRVENPENGIFIRRQGNNITKCVK